MIAYDQTELAQALISEIGDALFLLDPDTDRLVEVNPVALRLTGFGRAELLALPATHLFRYDTPGGAQRLKGAFSKTVVFHGQDGFLLRTRDDHWVPVSLTVSRLHVEPRPLGLIIARDDRDRRAALAQARRVEAELRTVLGSAPAALWSAERAAGPDPFAGWHFRYVSPLLARIAGRPPEFFDHPFRWAEAVHPDEREAYRGAVRKLLLTGGESERLYRVLTPGGEVRWVHDRLRAVPDDAGRPVRLDGCLTDVTEQRAAEDALRESEERFRALVEKSRDGITLLDAAGALLYTTPAAKQYGFEPDALVGLDVFAYAHPDDVPRARKLFERAVSRPGEDVPGTLRMLTADGRTRLFEMNLVNRLDDPSVQAVVVNYRDVTDRDTSARALAHQHALLEGLFASVPDILCYKDRDDRFLGGNPAFEAFAGRPMAELVGKRCREVFSGDWVERLIEAERAVIAAGQPGRGKEWLAYPDGRKVLLDILLAPLRDEAGAVIGVIVLGRDVTEQHRLEEELRQAHKMEAVGRLAGGIAHDFNNLLTVVLGNLELVRCGAAGADPGEMLAGAERAARQAAELTKQMLGFARRQALHTASVDLNELVRESLGMLRRTIDPRIEVLFRPDPRLRPVVADPVQLQQVLMNLCLNARDAMPEGGTLTLETVENEPGPYNGGRGCVRLSVSDTGVGMSEEVRAKVFDPFFTTKGVGQGTGLGLAVVYGVATAHGGSVEVTSAPGRGSRFDVYLPRGRASDDRTGGAPRATTEFPRGGGETVLVADDEAAVRELARMALELAGYKVLLARDGAEAVDVFRGAADRVRLVVLDASMPKMSGRQAFEVIRALVPAVKVLFASGYNGGGLLPDGDPHHTGRLNKPYVPTQLAEAVHRMLSE